MRIHPRLFNNRVMSAKSIYIAKLTQTKTYSFELCLKKSNLAQIKIKTNLNHFKMREQFFHPVQWLWPYTSSTGEFIRKHMQNTLYRAINTSIYTFYLSLFANNTIEFDYFLLVSKVFTLNAKPWDKSSL